MAAFDDDHSMQDYLNCYDPQWTDGLGFPGLDTELSPISLCSPSLPFNEQYILYHDDSRLRNVSYDVDYVKLERFDPIIPAFTALYRRHTVESDKGQALAPGVLFSDFPETIAFLERFKIVQELDCSDVDELPSSPGSVSSSINSTPPPITPPNHLSATIPLPAHLFNSTKDSVSLQSDEGAECTSADGSGRPSGATTSTNTDGHATRTGYATPPIMQNSTSLDRGEHPPSPGATRTYRRANPRHSPYPVDRDHRAYRGDRSHFRNGSLSPPPTSSTMATDRLGRLRSAKWSPASSSREGSMSPSEDAHQPTQPFVPRIIRPPPSYGTTSHSRSSSAPHHLPPLQVGYRSTRYYDAHSAHDRSVSNPTSFSYSNPGDFPVSSERGPSHDPPSPPSTYPSTSTSSRASSSRSYDRRPRGHSPYSTSADYYVHSYNPGGATSYRTAPYYDHKGKGPAPRYHIHSGSSASNSEDEDYDRDEDMDYSSYSHGPHSGHRTSPPSSRTSSTSRFLTPPSMAPLNMGPSNSVFSANPPASQHHITNGIPLLLTAASSTAPPSGRRQKKSKLMQGEMEIPPPPKPTATPTPSFAKKKKSNTGRIRVQEEVLDGQRRFLCPMYHSGSCRQSFSRRNDAYRHLDSCHRELQMQNIQEGGEVPDPTVIGPDRCGCGQLLSRLDALNRHYKTCKWRKEQGLPPPVATSAQAGKKRKAKGQSGKKAGKKKGGTSGNGTKGRRSHSGSEDDDEEDELESEEESEEEDQLMDD